MDVHRISQHSTVVPLRPARERHPRDDGSGLRFGRFRLLPAARLLLRDDREVGLGDRAFDLLQTFLAAPGVILTKAEIVARVWPSTRVEEGNLRFQICSLRRALGADGELIRTVAGRGYLFAGAVETTHGSSGQDGEGRSAASDVEALRATLAACERLRAQLAAALDQVNALA